MTQLFGTDSKRHCTSGDNLTCQLTEMVTRRGDALANIYGNIRVRVLRSNILNCISQIHRNRCLNEWPFAIQNRWPISRFYFLSTVIINSICGVWAVFSRWTWVDRVIWFDSSQMIRICIFQSCKCCRSGTIHRHLMICNRISRVYLNDGHFSFVF